MTTGAARTELRQGGPLDSRYARGRADSQPRRHRASQRAAGRSADRRVFRGGRAAFEGLALCGRWECLRCLPANPVALDIARPAELEWKSTKAELAQIEKLPAAGLCD